MILPPIIAPIGGSSYPAIVSDSINTLLDWPLLTSLVPTKSTGLPSFTRATAAMFIDHESKYWQVLSGEARFNGARRVENLLSYSEDFSDAVWIDSKSAVISTTENDPFGGSTAADIDSSAGAGAGVEQILSKQKAGSTFIASVYAKTDDSGLSLQMLEDGVAIENIILPATSSWQRFWIVGVATDQNAILSARTARAEATGNYQIAFFMFEEVPSGVTSPSEYVSSDALSSPYHGSGVDAVKCFETEKSGHSVSFIGDSFIASSYVVQTVDRLHDYKSIIFNKGVSGESLDEMNTRFAADVIADSPDVVIIQGGVNDLLDGRSLVQMQTSINSMLSAADTAGITPVIVNIAPWKNYAGWTEGRQIIQNNYNAWLLTIGRTIVDIFTDLEDPSNADELLPLYDSGDGLHPSSPDGYDVVSGLISSSYISPIFTTIVGLDGVLIEPTSTNKCECYSTPGADQLGSEMITVADDRTFDSDTGFWTKGAGVTISGGNASFAAVTLGLALYSATSLGIESGKVYEVTYTVSNYSAGNIGYSYGGIVSAGGTDSTRRSANGTYTEILETYSTDNNNTANGRLVFDTNGFTGDIDDVSVKEVGGTDSSDGSFVSGIGTDATAYHDGSVFQNPIPGMTLSGDVAVVLSIVDDQTALEAFGSLDIIASPFKVYKLDNSLGAAVAVVAIDGLHGNTNSHALSVFARAVGGATSDIRNNYSDGITAISGGDTFARYASDGYTPSNSNAKVSVRAVAGDIIYFLIPQLEEHPNVTSPILTNSAGVTRNKDELDIQIEGNFEHDEGTMLIDWTPHYASSVLTFGEGIVALRGSFASILYLGTGSSGKLSSTDNTNYPSEPTAFLSDVIQKTAVAWGTSLAITRNGTTGSSNPYDGDFSVDVNNFISFGQDSKSPFSVANFKINNAQKTQTWLEEKTS